MLTCLDFFVGGMWFGERQELPCTSRTPFRSSGNPANERLHPLMDSISSYLCRQREMQPGHFARNYELMRCKQCRLCLAAAIALRDDLGARLTHYLRSCGWQPVCLRDFREQVAESGQLYRLEGRQRRWYYFPPFQHVPSRTLWRVTLI